MSCAGGRDDRYALSEEDFHAVKDKRSMPAESKAFSTFVRETDGRVCEVKEAAPDSLDVLAGQGPPPHSREAIRQVVDVQLDRFAVGAHDTDLCCVTETEICAKRE